MEGSLTTASKDKNTFSLKLVDVLLEAQTKQVELKFKVKLRDTQRELSTCMLTDQQSLSQPFVRCWETSPNRECTSCMNKWWR